MPCGSLSLSQISREEYWLLLLLLEAAPPPASAADSARPGGRWINGDLRRQTQTQTQSQSRTRRWAAQLAFASRRTARLLPGEVRRAHVRGGPNNDAALDRAFGDCMAVTGLVHQGLALSRRVGAGAGAVRARVVEEQHRAVVDRRAQEQRLRTAGPPSEQGRKGRRRGEDTVRG